ncbi:helix-turn-helix domain-containing protein [Geminicoccus roseus]|uniref:helix-turn-helix domain-containing protein n=1 Tax=Geminicoccus roseus TaxID=404900 RepID=UPI00041A85CB|nr:helix-turn-helix domain-containing protein [Geminicoccus roseus]
MRKQAICAALEDHELDELQSIMIASSLAPHQTLVEEGEPRRKVFTLTSGMLRLYTMLPDGRRQITAFLLPGDYLGLGDEETYDETAEAVIESKLCGFPVAEMERLMELHPRLHARLYQMTRIALRQARDSQMILGRLAPVEKIASFLLVLSARAVEHGQPGNPVHLAMTRMDIADYLGLTIETVSRSFTKLRVQGLIRLPDAHQVEIVDRRALTAVAGIEPR